MSQPRSIQDAALAQSVALPATATHVETDGVDLGAKGDLVADFEILISAPALDGTELPAAATMIYALEDSADDSTYAVLQQRIIVQTGAGSVGGAAAAERRLRLPSTVRRYVRVSATGVGNGDCSGKSFTQKFLF